jgi:hypothetical protein
MGRRRATRRAYAEVQQARQFAELRAAAAARQQARQLAEFRAAAESGQWFVICTGNWEKSCIGSWENGQYVLHKDEQMRSVFWGRLRAQHPDNWCDYDLPAHRPGALEWLENSAEVETRLRPQPAPQPAPARNYWSDQVPVPPAAPPVQRTASQNQALNANGPTAQNLARNRGGNAY